MRRDGIVGLMGHEGEHLLRLARRLEARRPIGKPPALVLFTDPGRTADPLADAARLPRGALVVYRHFGAPDAEATARVLAKLCRRRGLRLLIGADASLAAKVRADGVHLPERLTTLAPRLKRTRRFRLVTAAAHNRSAVLRAAQAGVDAVFVSPVFSSRSASATRPLGPLKFARLTQRVSTPIYALGGVNSVTAKRLGQTRIWGFAAVDALSRS